MRNLLIMLFCATTSLLAVTHRSSYPFIAGDTFREFANVVLDSQTRFDPARVKAGDVIFVQIDLLEEFFKNFHTRIQHPYILLTHNCDDQSDDPVPGPFVSWVSDPKIIAWFTQNIDTNAHEKLIPLPIGLANHYYAHGNTATFTQFMNNAQGERNKLLYMNFSVHTYPPERGPVFALFKNKKFCTVFHHGRHLPEYLGDLKNHKFALSPRGHGLDCHRTWESLLMGTIPVVKSSTLDPLYEDLPVLVIHDWLEVTEEFLHRKYIEIASKQYDLRKIFAQYWFDKIHTARDIFLKNR